MVNQGPQDGLTDFTTPGEEKAGEGYFDYSQRAQWLRAVVLGGNEGLVATTVLVMGMGTVVRKTDVLIFTGLVGLVAGALNVGIAAFVSVYTQVDIMKSQADRDLRMGGEGQIVRAPVPSPTQVAVGASLAYAIVGMVPLLAVGLIRDDKVRIIVAAIVACLSMLGLGKMSAFLGKAPVGRSCARLFVGCCVEIMVLWAQSKILVIYLRAQ